MNDLKLMETEICDLLRAHAITPRARNVLAPWVARESLKMNHLYEDLGFTSRTQMGAFMKEHFPELAAQKPKDKLWKKFLYDAIGKVAPACATCDDQATCFKCILQEMSA
jgi:nitrogen fixation protein NifQ